MDRKQTTNRQFSSSGTVSFAPAGGSLKRDARLNSEAHDSIIGGSILRDSANAHLLQPRKDSLSTNHGKIDDLKHYVCRFQTKWRVLSYLQIIFGLLSFFVDLYSHFPLFSCGWVLSAGADWLWFGTWIGIINLICGVVGGAARLGDLSFSSHKFLRRMYFVMNCSFVPFVNGIGLASYGITLASVPLICNTSVALQFTAVTAFISFILLTICILLNILGIVFQACATIKCKCWICDPKNQTPRGYART